MIIVNPDHVARLNKASNHVRHAFIVGGISAVEIAIEPRKVQPVVKNWPKDGVRIPEVGSFVLLAAHINRC